MHSSVIHETAQIDSSAIIHPGCHIGENVVIGPDCEIGPNAVVVRDNNKVIDYFFDPPQHSNAFYPPQTFMLAKVCRNINELGGYFIALPNGNEGFLVTKKNYKEGDTVKVMSRVFYESEKPQRFSDKLRIVSDFCIIEENSKCTKESN